MESAHESIAALVDGVAKAVEPMGYDVHVELHRENINYVTLLERHGRAPLNTLNAGRMVMGMAKITQAENVVLLPEGAAEKLAFSITNPKRKSKGIALILVKAGQNVASWPDDWDKIATEAATAHGMEWKPEFKGQFYIK